MYELLKPLREEKEQKEKGWSTGEGLEPPPQVRKAEGKPPSCERPSNHPRHYGSNYVSATKERLSSCNALTI